ncbi:hypothetical protein AAMO2058_000969700 [Amorphochlora amoebiformis]
MAFAYLLYKFQLPSSTISEYKKTLGRNEITFKRIGFRVNKLSVQIGKKKILHPFDAEFNPGELIAIMGPSGAGKSTIMSALMGKLDYSGQIYINDSSKRGLDQSKIGFVPQDDIMNTLLTPREILTYSAKTRLSSLWSAEHIYVLVTRVLNDLGLTEQQNTIIGDEYQRGISGGEKKRVNIGIELVANPSALFLDEPTSGLDASSAEEVTQVLKNLAQEGRCVVAVIHQPRFESFMKFDKILLVTKENGLGACCYFGPSNLAAHYFSYIDARLKCPVKANPANHVLDIVSGAFDSVEENEDAKTGGGNRVSSSQLRTIWAQTGESFLSANLQSKRKFTRQLSPLGRVDPPPPAILRLMTAMIVRTTRLQIRDVEFLRVFSVLSCFMAVALSVGFSPFLLSSYQDTFELAISSQLAPWCPPFLECDERPRDYGLQQLLFFLNVAMSAITMTVGARLFPLDILVIEREAKAGVPVAVQAIIMMLVNLLPIFFFTTIFLGWWMAFGHPGMPEDWAALLLSLGFASSGVGYMVSTVLEYNQVYSTCMVLGLLIASFNGVSPRLQELPPGARWLWDLSFSRWSGEATYSLYTQHLVDNGHNVQIGANGIGYTIGRFGFDLGMMWVLGFVFRILAVIMLYCKIHRLGISDLLDFCGINFMKENSQDDTTEVRGDPVEGPKILRMHSDIARSGRTNDSKNSMETSLTFNKDFKASSNIHVVSPQNVDHSHNVQL